VTWAATLEPAEVPDHGVGANDILGQSGVHIGQSAQHSELPREGGGTAAGQNKGHTQFGALLRLAEFYV
jgi:hypothetical protein